jgi:hypothetical protein
MLLCCLSVWWVSCTVYMQVEALHNHAMVYSSSESTNIFVLTHLEQHPAIP